LQVLPVQWQQVLAGKVLGALALVIAIPLLILILGAIGQSGLLPIAEGTIQYGLVYVSSVMLYFTGAVVCSLLFREVITAALAAVAFGSLIDTLLVASTATTSTDFFSIVSFFPTVGLRCLIGPCLFLLAIPLARRWWVSSSTQKESRRSTALAAAELATTAPPGLAGQATWQGLTPKRTTALRLIWQSSIQSHRSLLLLFAIIVSPSLLVGVFASRVPLLETQLAHSLAIGMMMLGCFLAGVFCFAADQRRNSFRFFAQHVERPALIWLTRNLYWVVALVVFCGLAIFLLRLDTTSSFPIGWQLLSPKLGYFQIDSPGDWSNYASCSQYFFACGLTIFAFSQLASIHFRSVFVAAFMAAIASALAIAWNYTAMLVSAPWWWSVLPLVIVALVCSLLWAPHWLIERNRWKGWITASAAMTLTAAILLVALNVRQTRIFPIGNRFAFAWAQQPTDDLLLQVRSKYSAAMLNAAGQADMDYGWASDYRSSRLPPDPTSVELAKKWLATNSETLSGLHTAADFAFDKHAELQNTRIFQRNFGAVEPETDRVPGPLEPIRDSKRSHVAIVLLESQVEIALIDEESEVAWRALETLLKIHQQQEIFYGSNWWNLSLNAQINQWASLPNVTEPQLQHAIEILQTTGNDLWQINRRGIAAESERLSNRKREWASGLGSLPAIVRNVAQLLIPTERTRENLHRHYVRQLLMQDARDWQTSLESEDSSKRLATAYQVFAHHHNLDERPRFKPDLNPLNRMLQRSYERSIGDTSPESELSYMRQRLARVLTNESWRRSLQVRLGIEIYQLREQGVPESLDDLVATGIFEQLPVDPVSGEDFAWLPDGVDKPIYVYGGDSISFFDTAANTPLLFSAPTAQLTEQQVRVVKRSEFHELNQSNKLEEAAIAKRGYTSTTARNRPGYRFSIAVRRDRPDDDTPNANDQ